MLKRLGVSSRLAALALTLGLLVALLVALPEGARALDDGPWEVTALEGAATATLPTKAPRALALGDRIQPGSEIATAADARVTLARGETTMTLAPDGRTRIPTDSDSGGRTTVFQRLGSLHLKVEKRPEQHFEVETPFLAAVVKGTSFTVEVGGAGAAVSVTEGAVEVGALATGQVQLVRPGFTARVTSDPGTGLELQESTRTHDVDHDVDANAGAADRDGTDRRLRPDAETGPASAALSAALSVGGTGGLAITRTLGAAPLDVSALTDGLVAPAPPPGRAFGALAVERQNDDGAGTAGAHQGTAAQDTTRTQVLAVGFDDGGVASDFVGSVSGRPSDATALANPARGLNAVAADVGQIVSTTVNPGVGNAGTPPGLALGHRNGNGAGGWLGGSRAAGDFGDDFDDDYDDDFDDDFDDDTGGDHND